MNNFARNASAAQRARFLPKAISRRMDRRHVHDRAGGRHRRARHAQHRPCATATTTSLNGRKIFITNGAIDDHTLGDVFLVYAKTDERASARSWSRRASPGFSLGQKLNDKLGMRASMTAELVFDACLVPVDQSARRRGRERAST